MLLDRAYILSASVWAATSASGKAGSAVRLPASSFSSAGGTSTIHDQPLHIPADRWIFVHPHLIPVLHVFAPNKAADYAELSPILCISGFDRRTPGIVSRVTMVYLPLTDRGRSSKQSKQRPRLCCRHGQLFVCWCLYNFRTGLLVSTTSGAPSPIERAACSVAQASVT
jgi:hypothetical protein